MVTYKDVVLKTNFYKEQVLKEIVKKGLLPDENIVQDRVKNIDRFLALFRNTNIKSGDKFDAKKYNKDIKLIYQDLLFLYQLVYEVTAKEFNYSKAYMNSHLIELESIARQYKIRSRIEIESSFLGNTVFFQSSGFPMFNKDNELYIDLGKVNLRQGSRITWLFEAGGIMAQDALLGLKIGESISYIGAHNFISHTYKVPGNPVIKESYFKLDDEQTISHSFEIINNEIKPSYDNSYFIFGGENKIILKTANYKNETIEEVNKAYYTQEDFGKIEFHIYKGTYANFSFSKQPKSKNFEGLSIKDLKSHHKVSMEVEGGMGFSIETDGKIYAEKELGIVSNDMLFFPKQSAVKDFFIEENFPGDKVEYEAFLKIKGDNIDLLEIESVTIKELTEMEVKI